jgi:hypothetical protein
MPSLFRGPWPKPSAVQPQDPDTRRATQLLNAAMSYARVILGRYGQLAPFAFGMDHEGQIARQVLEIPRLPRDPERLYKLISEHVAGRVRHGQLQGVALCANVALAAPSAEKYTDAVVLTLELESGYAVRVTVPYRIYGGQFHKLLPRRVALGQLVMEDAAARFFTAS